MPKLVRIFATIRKTEEIGHIRKLPEQEESDLRHEVAGGGFVLGDENCEKIKRIGDERMEHGQRPDGLIGARLTAASGRGT
jgi:hypothetical protein